MGLSNEERYIGMLLNVEHITELASNLDSCVFRNLKKHAENLWPVFRSAYSDGSGYYSDHYSNLSLSDSRIGSFENPTYVAFRHIKSLYINDNIIGLITYDDKSYLTQCLEMEHIINDVNLSKIISISNCIEYFRSYINRYDDEFSKKYKSVDHVISLIEREIYLIFRDNTKVYDAWIVKNMLGKIVNAFDNEDILYAFIMANKHNFRISEQTDGKFLSKWYFDKLQDKGYGDFTLTERLEVLLIILGRRFYYLGDHEKLLKLIKAQDVDVKLIESYLTMCIQKRKDYDDANRFDIHKIPCYLKNY